tara:strand:- start:226 stop:543 length:318 start_codon:yes stop_codon:yes gene_type:complete
MAIRVLIALFLFVAPATASPLGELGRPAAGMQTLSPCWLSEAFGQLIKRSGFTVTVQGLLTESIDPARPAFVMYTHRDGRFIAVVRQQRRKITCVMAAGDEANSI